VVKYNLRSTVFSLRQLSEDIRSGNLSPTDLIEVCIDKIKNLNPRLGAFITVVEKDELIKKALIAENEIKKGNYRGPLHGIPFSVKDIFYVKGLRCTCGSKILADYIPKSNATVVKRMKDAGAILVGTNNLNEFASGITGVNPFYGSSKNPWNPSRLSGGSSGGSAVAVATGMVMISLGTDTGGSIRVPASLCGVVGLKPTYGRISRHKIFPLAPTLDHVGCITRSAWDAATVLEYIAGRDPFDDSTAFNTVEPYTKNLEEPNLEKRRIGVLKPYFCDYLHPEVSALFQQFTELLGSANAEVIFDLNIGQTNKFYDSWRDIRLAEAANVHRRWLNNGTTSSEYSDEVRQMLVAGTMIPAVNYILSMETIREIRNSFLKLFSIQNLDAFVVPTTIIPAPRFGQEKVNVCRNVTLDTRQALLRNTIVFNSIGLPSVSIPIGLTKKDNLPVGAQIIGAPFKEETILSIAYCHERISNSLSKFVA
jgi:aspartyl-tRNA(Asn)/glutamyl-tRNA(Gln) amidotransferase subunit A